MGGVQVCPNPNSNGEGGGGTEEGGKEGKYGGGESVREGRIQW